ncbi:ATP-binding protein [uncultured Fibrella sp.]|uniref:ATP-binding protein n=1 Tax=uncultured Fibrella sp. TaxID=1284596 RepID=UPI0035CCA3FE
MIYILFNGKYKSLLQPFEVKLPDFTVISGVNGAGKSHFLTAIEQGQARVFEDGVEISTKKYVNSNTLSPNDSYQVERTNLINDANNISYILQNFQSELKKKSDLTLEQHLINTHNQYQFGIIDKIVKDTNKDISEISIEDIKDNYPLTYGYVSDVFYQNFSAIFKRYYDRYEDNFFNEYLTNVKGKKVKFLTEDRFISKYGSPPWDFVNRIFDEAGIDYTINNPLGSDRDLPFTFKLINKLNGATVNFSDLSSGEKVLMSLTLSLYNSKTNISFPKLLLLDEPDAPLHPSMAKQLLQVIENVFVKEKGVKVILTTHSPSTIAMAPDESLYVMQKDSPRIQKRSKEQLMKLLTDGIPSFSIYADNRRQVFVESEIDADFYTRIYGKLKKKIQSDKSLYFISSGSTRGNSGNCDQVKDIVNTLTRTGNQTVYGIIDWDKRNQGNERIIVLGQNKRYSIENYIFDPLLLSNFLLREKLRDRSYFGLSDDESFLDFPKFSVAKLQGIIDIVISDIISKLENHSELPQDKLSMYYCNGMSFNLPIWYLQYQGHDLEKVIKATYQELGKFQKLKEEVVKKVIDDLPDFISIDILDLLQSLHN